MRKLSLFFTGVFWISAIYAQEDRASIAGEVTDPSGASVPRAAITVTNLDRNTTVSMATSDSGRYQVPFLFPGPYSVTIEAQGFKKYVRPRLELTTGERLGLDVTLEIGGTAESVTVTGQVGLLETETSQRGQLISSKELHELPNQGRNVFQMVWAVAGVTRTGTGWGSMSPQGVANATGFSLNGGRGGENEVLVDGVSDVHGGRQVKNVPSLETVSEFKVIANPYDSSFGRTGGGTVTFTTKGGTNQLHGVAWEFAGNNKFNANAFALNRTGQPRPQSNVNLFGFEVDGPVVIPKVVDGRNKVFFMFSYEGWRGRSVDVQNFTMPLPEQRTGDFSGLFAANGQLVSLYDPLTTQSDGRGGFVRTAFPGNRLPANRISPIAPKAAGYLPQATYGGQGPGHVNNYIRATPFVYGINQEASRIDYNISANHRVYFRYSNTPYEEVRSLAWGDNVAEPSGNAPLTRNGVNWSLDWTSNFGPRTVFDLRFGLTRWEDFSGNLIGRGYNPKDLGFPDTLVSQFKVLQFPRFDIAGGYAPLGTNRPGNLETDYAYSLQPNLNLVRGKHVLKLGAEFRRFEKNRVGLGLISGAYSFTRDFTQSNPLRADALSGNEFASFLLGYPAGGQVDNNMHPAYRFYYYSGFVHDDWKVSPRLTLNIGLRYDYEAPLSERYNRQVRGFAFGQPSPIADRVQGLKLTGGILYAGTSGSARQAYDRDFFRPQPRFGFAYKLKENWVLRGGYGIFFLGQYEEGPGNGYSRPTPLIASNDGGLTPLVTLSNPFPGTLLQPVGNTLGLATDLGLGISAQYLDRPHPYSQQFSFGIQRQLRGGWVVESAYQGNYTNRIAVNAAANNLPVSELGKPSSYYTDRVPNPMAGLLPNNVAKNGATIPRQDLLVPFPQYTNLTLLSVPIGKQRYHGWQNSVKKRFSQGYTFQAAYTFSKTLEETSFLNNQDFNLSSALNSRLERRLVDWDAPQKLALLATYEIPVGRGKRLGKTMHPVANGLVGGWQLNGNLTLQSGFPVPFPNAAPNAARSAKLSGDQQTNERWFDISLWRDSTGRPVPAQAPFTLRDFPTRFGDVRFPALKNLDLSLFKDFAVTERMKFNFRAEWYNITNTPWFPRLDNTSVTAATFGSLNLSQTNTPKRLVLGLRLVW